MPGKIDYGSAAGTNQVMMVLPGAHGITATTPSGMNLADETKFGKDFQGAVDSHQPNSGVYISYFFMDIGRSKVITAGSDYLNDGPTLGGKLIAVLF